MRTQDLNRVNMIRTTCAYCDDNAAATAAITNYAAVVTEAKNKLVLIDNLNIVAGGTSTGVTIDTNNVRNAMMLLTEKLCNGLQAYGGATNNNTIIAAAKYSFSSLSKLAKEDVDDVCEGVYNLANANSGALASYGINPTDISDTITAISLYRTDSDNPRQKIIQQKVANDQIPPIIKDIIDNLFTRQLDKLTNTLKSSNQPYIDGYYGARTIIDLGTQHTIKLDVSLAFPVPLGISEIDLSGINMAQIDEVEIRNTAAGTISAGFGASSSALPAPATIGAGASVTDTPVALGYDAANTHLFLINVSGATTFRVIMRG